MQSVAQGRAEPAFLTERPAGSSASLEGFLFPDTYQFPKRTSAPVVIEMMLQNWDQRVTPEIRQMAEESGLTLYEVLTLASIVEREAVVASERALIAGVYANRLGQGMMLQADPTVQYAKGYNAEKQLWWSPLVLQDLQTTVSPYNTYQNVGLTPGPICNPGLDSILAAARPASTEYLYFVSKGDGSHVFSKTFEEHLKNQELYSKP